MTDRTNYLTVVLDGTYREDDVESITDAIAMIKGVIDVKINVTDPIEYMAVSSAKHDLRKKLYEVLN
jgi:hypothetical protein